MWLVGCKGEVVFKPINETEVVFWDRQTAESAFFIREKSTEFNAIFPGLPIKVERAGGYAEIFRKVSASIQAGRLPAMAVSYESMTSEYIPTGAVILLDEYIFDSEVGLTKEELEDFFPCVLEANKYRDFGNKMYSFPLAKSVLVLYYNLDVLDKVGISNPPETWEEFLNYLELIKEKTGRYGYAISVDCSTVDAMIYSFGGEIVSGRETLFDSEVSKSVFRFYRELIEKDLAYVVPPGSFDDQVALAKGEVGFIIRSSSLRISLERIAKERPFRWGIGKLPHLRGVLPVTVLFGPNITIFKTTEDQQRRAWEFVKFMTSRENVVEWAIHTGYVPIRRSSATHPDMVEYWKNNPKAKVPFDSLEFARPEPNISGWQQVRDLVEAALLEVLTLMDTPENVCSRLKKRADSVLSMQ
ncbi:MAG: ABC transporter substrate-binding protein [Candidatus Hydrogenedentes bacterium]|nr:ABC transporter substrate-binding protein [Candidatus Hydrogenedentota bacterium]